jgi:hypothetical protein
MTLIVSCLLQRFTPWRWSREGHFVVSLRQTCEGPQKIVRRLQIILHRSTKYYSSSFVRVRFLLCRTFNDLTIGSLTPLLHRLLTIAIRSCSNWWRRHSFSVVEEVCRQQPVDRIESQSTSTKHINELFQCCVSPSTFISVKLSTKGGYRNFAASWQMMLLNDVLGSLLFRRRHARAFKS